MIVKCKILTGDEKMSSDVTVTEPTHIGTIRDDFLMELSIIHSEKSLSEEHYQTVIRFLNTYWDNNEWFTSRTIFDYNKDLTEDVPNVDADQSEWEFYFTQSCQAFLEQMSGCLLYGFKGDINFLIILEGFDESYDEKLKDQSVWYSEYYSEGLVTSKLVWKFKDDKIDPWLDVRTSQWVDGASAYDVKKYLFKMFPDEEKYGDDSQIVDFIIMEAIKFDILTKDYWKTEIEDDSRYTLGNITKVENNFKIPKECIREIMSWMPW